MSNCFLYACSEYAANQYGNRNDGSSSYRHYACGHYLKLSNTYTIHARATGGITPTRSLSI